MPPVNQGPAITTTPNKVPVVFDVPTQGLQAGGVSIPVVSGTASITTAPDGSVTLNSVDSGGNAVSTVVGNNYKKPTLRGGVKVIENWSSAIVAGGATVVADIDALYPTAASLQIIGNSGTTCSGYKALAPLWPAASKCKTVVVRAKCVASGPRPIQVRLYNVALNKYLNAFLAIPSDGKWHTFSLDEASLTPGAGFVLGTDEIAYAQFRDERSNTGQLSPLATDGSESIVIGSVWIERGTRAKFLFTFDDSQVGLVTPSVDVPNGYPSSGYTARDILAYYGFVGTAYVIPDYLGQTGYESVNALLELQNSGWDVGSHSQASETGQVGNSTHGLRTIGTFGLGPFNITGVAANALTISAHPFATSKVTVGGTVAPSGLTIGATYWTRNVSTNTVTLHPTRLDANNSTNTISITSAGVSSFLRWTDAVGKTKIVTTVTGDMGAVRSFGFSAWEHYALPQGGYDNEVLEAFQGIGAKTIRGVESGRYYVMGIHKAGIAANLPGLNWCASPIFIGSCANLTAATPATIQGYIDGAIYTGATTGIYAHSLTASDAVKLDAVAAYIAGKVAAGLIDVVTVSQWHSQLSDICDSVST